MSNRVILLYGGEEVAEICSALRDISLQVVDTDHDFLASLSHVPSLIILDDPEEKMIAAASQTTSDVLVLSSKEAPDCQRGRVFCLRKPLHATKILDFCLSVLEKERNRLYVSGSCIVDMQLRQAFLGENCKKSIDLTEKEISLINYLYHAPYNKAERSELLHHIWGYSKDVSTHTLETHWYRLRQKFLGELDFYITDDGYFCIGSKVELLEDG